MIVFRAHLPVPALVGLDTSPSAGLRTKHSIFDFAELNTVYLILITWTSERPKTMDPILPKLCFRILGQSLGQCGGPGIAGFDVGSKLLQLFVRGFQSLL